tara:strand:+ start:593 stop:760 length:168 start_codon:yes stop_codon:yes gene_type:complete
MQKSNYGDEEINAAIKILKDERSALICVKYVSNLENKVAKIFRKHYGLIDAHIIL